MLVGDFDTNVKMDAGDIYLKFYSDNFTLNWEQASKLADYLSHYYTQSVLSCTESQHKEVLNNVSYVVNELFENSIKFNSASDLDVSIQINTQENNITLITTNNLSKEKVTKFAAFLKNLLAADPEAYLVEKITENIEKDTSGSGLGYITLILNYHAKLGFKFEEQDNGLVKVFTMAKMPMISDI